MSLNVAVVGLGHGRSYLPLLKAHPRARLAALADVHPERLHKAAEEFGVPGYASLEELIKARCADAVILALPTPAHAEATTLSLAAGLHVLLEKPLCRDDAEAETIAQAVKRSKHVFQVGYEVRSSPLHRAVLEHIRRGDLGEITNVWYNQHTDQAHGGAQAWRETRTNMGGKLFDCAVHYFDLMQQWAGAPVNRMAALGHLLRHTGACSQELPESAVVAIEYTNGVRGTYNFGARNRFLDDATFGVAGTTGRLAANPFYPQGAGSYELRTDCGLRVANVVLDGKLTSTGHLGFKEQLDNFIATVLDGAPNVCPVADAIAVHRQMRLLDQALATGQVVAAAAP